MFRTLPACAAFRCYVSTEAPTTTLGISDTSDVEACALTDDEVYNNEVRIIDESGNPVPTGEEGEITVLRPERMLGYTRAEDNAAAFDADGYWKSGDLGWLDTKGRITINGRKKDLIIRGGENFSAREIEDALHSHRDIRQASVVGAPHPRLGEMVCAFVVPCEGRASTWQKSRANWPPPDWQDRSCPSGLSWSTPCR